MTPKVRNRKKSTVFFDQKTKSAATLGGKLLVWVASTPEKMFELGFIDAKVPYRATKKLTVETLSGRTINASEVFPANSTVSDDLTKLQNISEPTILHNLEERVMDDHPYTWVGPMLVAVNPIKEVKNPCAAGSLDASKCGPHPFSLAESIVSKLTFSRAKGKPQSQSILVSGESGSGKTVTAKLILKHIVRRLYVPEWGVKDDAGLDEKMLDTNPILESFGNAMTLRNNNSSRFGKYFKLHIDGEGFINGASLQTYLLERSRMTAHELGERTFHVFYQLLAGCSKDRKKALSLDTSFAYLSSAGKESNSASDSNTVSSELDKKNFVALENALESIDVAPDEQEHLFEVLAGILHLGNIEISISKDGERATVSSSSSSLSKAAALWGFKNVKELRNLFCERVIYVGREKTIVPLSQRHALKARDAIAKDVYARTFDWLQERINFSVNPNHSSDGPEVFVGVLDVFGFESFERNDLEQLLINFANERLQVSFNSHVLQAESDLYQKEGLTLRRSAEQNAAISRKLRESTESPLKSRMSVLAIQLIFKMLDQEAQNMNPSDASLVKKIHSSLASDPSYKQVHPSKRATCFTIVHFAGIVTYTAGNFLEKNDDSLPSETEEFLTQSTNPVLLEVLDVAKRNSNSSISSKKSGKSSKGFSKSSVAFKFMGQIDSLIDTLDSTSCSFVRCIKPNHALRRFDIEAEKESKSGKSFHRKSVSIASAPPRERPWFDRRYISMQMASLGILQTALVLKDGLPIRMTFDELLVAFEPILNGCVEQVFVTHGLSSPACFAAATLNAFGFQPGTYRLGLTTVFFNLECADELDVVFRTLESWSENGSKNKKEINRFARDFSSFVIRRRWKRVMVAVRFINRMSWSTRILKVQGAAAVRIQANLRRFLAQANLNRHRKGVIAAQKLFRGARGRAIALDRIQELEHLKLEREKEAAALEELEQLKREAQDKERAKKAAAEEELRKQQEEEKLAVAREKEKAAEEELQRSREEEKSSSREEKPRRSALKGSRAASKNSRSKKGKEKSEDRVQFAASTKVSEENPGENSVKEKKNKSRGSKKNATPEPGPQLETNRFERVRKMSLAPNTFDQSKIEKAIEGMGLKEEEKKEKLLRSYSVEDLEEEEEVEIDNDADDDDGEALVEAEENRCISVVACKLAIRSRNSWKRRKLVLNPAERTISYYPSKTSKKKDAHVGVFRVNPPDYRPPPVVMASHLTPDVTTDCVFAKSGGGLGGLFSSGHRGKFMVEIKGGKLNRDLLQEDRSMILAFDQFQEMEEWRDELEKMLSPILFEKEQQQKKKKKRHENHFGEQIRCKNKRCGASNNTLYGTVCLECGTPLFRK